MVPNRSVKDVTSRLDAANRAFEILRAKMFRAEEREIAVLLVAPESNRGRGHGEW